MSILRPWMEEVVTWLTSAIRERKRWRSSRVHGPNGVRVFYGCEILPTSRNIASGGLVKTQDLQALFPNTPQNPNVLYLISSALPPYAPRMARWARKAGARVVLNQNGVAYPAWHGVGWEASNRVLREVLEQADYVFYQSHFCKLGADRFLKTREENYEVMYNPVDTAFYQPSAFPPPRNQIRLLLSGTHTHFYRAQSAVDVLKHLRDSGLNATLEIAGRCCWLASRQEAEAQLCAYIQQQGLSEFVILSGPYTQEQARLIFQRAHILLHTKYNDPCPRLVVEAMASGLPVVYSASGGTPELVGEEAGVGVPAPLDWEQDHPPAPDLLARAINQIWADYNRYSVAARQRAVLSFDVKPWIERHRAVFVRLLEGGEIER